MVESSYSLLGYLLLFLREDVFCRKLHVPQRSSDLLYSHKLSMSLFSFFQLFPHISDQQDKPFSIIYKSVHILISGHFSVGNWWPDAFPKALTLGTTAPTAVSFTRLSRLYCSRTKSTAYSNIRAESFLWTNLVLSPLLSVGDWGREASDLADSMRGLCQEMKVEDREAWHIVVHGGCESWTWLGDWKTAIGVYAVYLPLWSYYASFLYHFHLMMDYYQPAQTYD